MLLNAKESRVDEKILAIVLAASTVTIAVNTYSELGAFCRQVFSHFIKVRHG